MNKKTLSIVVTLLSLAMITTSLFGTVQACRYRCRRTTEPYYVEYVMYTIQPPTIKTKGDYIIYKGTVSQGAYEGPVGTGTMTAEMIILMLNTATGKGWSILKSTLVITSGPYGAGTLVGFSWFTYDGSHVPVSGGTCLRGNGDLSGILISAKKGYTPISTGVMTVWEDGRITHP